MAHTLPKLVVLNSKPMNSARLDDDVPRVSAAPITSLRRHPIARLAEHFAARHHADGTIHLLRIVGVSEERADQGKKPPLSSGNKLYVPYNSKKSAIARILHHEFAKAHLGQTRAFLSQPAQALYDELLNAADGAWAYAAGVQVSTKRSRDPISGRSTTEYTSDGDPLTFGMPHGGQAEGRQVSVPGCLTAGMQMYLADHMGTLEKNMGNTAKGYTRQQFERDHNLIRNRVLPLITYYPPLRSSFLLNGEVSDYVGLTLRKTLAFAEEQEKKPIASATVTRMLLTQVQRSRWVDGQQVYPESPN